MVENENISLGKNVFLQLVWKLVWRNEKGKWKLFFGWYLVKSIQIELYENIWTWRVIWNFEWLVQIQHDYCWHDVVSFGGVNSKQ